MSATIELQNIEAERQLCGSLPLQDAATRKLREAGLTPGDFAYKKHGLIFAAAVALDDDGRPVDEISLNAELDRRGNLSEVGGKNALPEMAASVSAPGNYLHHGEIVRDLAKRRATIALAEQLAESVRAGANGEATAEFLARIEQAGTSTHSGGLRFVRGDTIELERVEFLDEHRTIPNKSLTVVIGGAGLGKTTFSIGLAAAGTRGNLPGTNGPINVLISSQEDDASAVLMPRFVAAGGDPKRVEIVKGLSIPDAVPELARHAKAGGAGLVIIDPISSHMTAGVQSHNVASVRHALEPVSEMASDLSLAVIAVAHPNKSASQHGLDRISGAGLGDAARSVIVFGTDPSDPDGRKSTKRIIGHQKLNTGPEAESREAEIVPVELKIGDGVAMVPTLKILGTSEVRAEEIMASLSPEEKSERDEAKDFLLELLAQGPVRSKEIKEKHASSAGHNWRTVRRAKDDLKINVEKKGDGWYWSLPEGGAA